MNRKKIIPLSNFINSSEGVKDLSSVSVIVNESNVPEGFVFGRESFISFLEKLDKQFELHAKTEEAAHNNIAGQLIDLIEEKIPVKSSFVRELRQSAKESENTDWIPLEEIIQSLHE